MSVLCLYYNNNNNKSFIADNCPYTYIKNLKIQLQKYNIEN